ncbi:hypothetical protein QL285_057026 [Trifolium repens]|nr:hypothetical protein QL285_057026 [Trifolium repens]
MHKPDHRRNCSRNRCQSNSTTETAAGATKFPITRSHHHLKPEHWQEPKPPTTNCQTTTTKSTVANHRCRESNPNQQNQKMREQ